MGAVVGLLDVDGGRKDASRFSTAQNGDVEEPTGQECIENWGSNNTSSLEKEISVLGIYGIHERTKRTDCRTYTGHHNILKDLGRHV